MATSLKQKPLTSKERDPLRSQKVRQPPMEIILTQVHGCRMCHENDLKGNPRPPDPAAPPVPGLVAGSEVAYWSEEQFINTIRTGVAPSGHTLSDSMPWKEFRNMTDDQLKAIWLYLKSQSGE